MSDDKNTGAPSTKESPSAPPESPARTKDELAIDARVEAETKRLAVARAQQEEMQKQQAEANLKASENSLHTRAIDASLGLVDHMGCHGRYVGVAPQAEKGDTKCPTCQQVLTGGNSKFTPLPYVVPEAGLMVKDPETGDFFALPNDGTLNQATAETWLAVINPATGKNIVPEASKDAAKERRVAAGLA